MNLKLEELRKRLLEPAAPPANPAALPPAGSSVYRHNPNEIYMIKQRSDQAGVAATEVTPSSDQLGTEAPGDQPPAAPATGVPASVTSAVLQYVKQAAALTGPAEVESMDPNGQYQTAQAVARVFEQTQVFQARLLELSQMLEPIEQMGEAASRTLEPLRAFHEQLEKLAETFAPMRAFQAQLAQLAQNFEPMKGLQVQLAQVSEAFQIHLGKLRDSLEPAKLFQAELSRLMHAFDPVAELQEKFEALAATFKGGSTGAEAATLQ